MAKRQIKKSAADELDALDIQDGLGKPAAPTADLQEIGVDAALPGEDKTVWSTIGSGAAELLNSTTPDLAQAIAELFLASPDLVNAVQEQIALLSGHPHAHEIIHLPGYDLGAEPSAATPDPALLVDASDRIEVVTGYRGRKSGEQFITPGLYANGDPALHGLEDYLITNGFARRV